jgi:putative ABC transport system substrate-binding protein
MTFAQRWFRKRLPVFLGIVLTGVTLFGIKTEIPFFTEMVSFIHNLLPKTEPNPPKRVAFLCMSNIGMIQNHIDGIQDYLNAHEIKFNSRILYHNRDQTLLKNQIEEVISWKADLCVSLGMLSSQTAHAFLERKTEGEIPLLFGGINNPDLCGIATVRGKEGNNCTGLAQDMSDFNEDSNLALLESLRIVRPDIKKVLVIFTSGSSLVERQVKGVATVFEANGVSVKQLPATSSQDVHFLSRKYITSDLDAVLVLRDQMIIQSLQFLRRECRAAGVTLFASDSESVTHGAAAGCCINEYEQGVLLGEYAYKILTDKTGMQARDLPITLFKISDLYKTFVNFKELRAQGVTRSIYDILKSPGRILLAETHKIS